MGLSQEQKERRAMDDLPETKVIITKEQHLAFLHTEAELRETIARLEAERDLVMRENRECMTTINITAKANELLRAERDALRDILERIVNNAEYVSVVSYVSTELIDEAKAALEGGDDGQ